MPDWYKEPKNSEEASDRERLAEDKEHPWSPIFDAKWFRVILDEAHSIKNKGSKSAYSLFTIIGTEDLNADTSSFTINPATSEKESLGNHWDTSQ